MNARRQVGFALPAVLGTVVIMALLVAGADAVQRQQFAYAEEQRDQAQRRLDQHNLEQRLIYGLRSAEREPGAFLLSHADTGLPQRLRNDGRIYQRDGWEFFIKDAGALVNLRDHRPEFLQRLLQSLDWPRAKRAALYEEWLDYIDIDPTERRPSTSRNDITAASIRRGRLPGSSEEFFRLPAARQLDAREADLLRQYLVALPPTLVAFNALDSLGWQVHVGLPEDFARAAQTAVRREAQASITSFSNTFPMPNDFEALSAFSLPTDAQRLCLRPQGATMWRCLDVSIDPPEPDRAWIIEGRQHLQERHRRIGWRLDNL